MRSQSRPALAPALLPQPDTANRLLGICFVLLSNLIFAFSNVLAKWSTAGFPLGESLLIRAGTALILVAPFLRLADLIAALRAHPGLQLLRMAFSAGEISCFYWALSSLQLADVSTFYLSTPIYVTAISAAVLRETVDRARWLAVLVGFAGVLVALHPSAGLISWPACVAMLGSALYSVVLAATRGLRRTPNLVLVALQLVSLLCVGLVTTPFAWVAPSLPALGLLSLVGAISILGYVCINRALQLAPASVVAPFQYASILWSIILGYLVFADIPQSATLAGAAIIIAAGAFILFRERPEERPEPTAPAPSP